MNLVTKKSNNFTHLEIVAVVALFGLLLGPFLAKGNMFYTKKGVLEKIQEENFHAVEIVDDEPNWEKFSRIVVRQSYGGEIEYYLDSDMLFRYKLHIIYPVRYTQTLPPIWSGVR